MSGPAGQPRVEDFGISEEDLARAPCAFLASHRAGFLASAYLVAAGVVFVLILSSGGALSAAAFFTVVILAAASVLLLPALMFLLCASERAEERWLCARFPKLRGCLAYRRAVAEHAEHARRAGAAAASPRGAWSLVAQEGLVEAVTVILGEVAGGDVTALDRQMTGVDLVVRYSRHAILVRCEAGPGPVDPSVGRELAAALADLDADRGLIVSAGQPTTTLAEYISSRPIAVVPPWSVEDELEDSASQPA